MGDNLRENWKVYLLMTFISAMFAACGVVIAEQYLNKEAKIENAASTVYVDEQHDISIKHTNDAIKIHAETEAANREVLQTEITAIKADTKFIKEWILTLGK